VTDMVIPPAAVEAGADAIEGYQIGGGFYACNVGIQDASKMSLAALEAALPHLRPLFETATALGLKLGRQEAAERAVDFDGYLIQATVNGDVEVSCAHCPTIHRFEPSRSHTGLLEIFQTARNHMRNCPGRSGDPT